jgi:hypothetical protein
MPSAGFEPAIPTMKRPQTYALNRAATAIGVLFLSPVEIEDVDGLGDVQTEDCNTSVDSFASWLLSFVFALRPFSLFIV